MFESFIRHRLAATIVILLVLALGSVILPQMPRTLNPDDFEPRWTFTVKWPNASSDEITRDLAQPLSRQFNVLSQLKDVHASITPGQARFTIEGQAGIEPQRLDQHIRQIVQHTQWPAGIQAPSIKATTFAPERVMELVLVAGPGGLDVVQSTYQQFKTTLLSQGLILFERSHISDRIQAQIPIEDWQSSGLSFADYGRQFAQSSAPKWFARWPLH